MPRLHTKLFIATSTIVLILLLLTTVTPTYAGNLASICKCSCYNKKHIILLGEGKAKHKVCSDCNKKFCIEQLKKEKDFCVGAKVGNGNGEEDEFPEKDGIQLTATCFGAFEKRERTERDSYKDQVIVYLYITITLSLLVFAFVKSFVIEWWKPPNPNTFYTSMPNMIMRPKHFLDSFCVIFLALRFIMSDTLKGGMTMVSSLRVLFAASKKSSYRAPGPFYSYVLRMLANLRGRVLCKKCTDARINRLHEQSHPLGLRGAVFEPRISSFAILSEFTIQIDVRLIMMCSNHRRIMEMSNMETVPCEFRKILRTNCPRPFRDRNDSVLIDLAYSHNA
ncbi:hypothetical protein G9A89_010001 [Geosiphon pyriformis]|nr:hypothetical protein G9A89_010001 [Geosiphon pyriformis]